MKSSRSPSETKKLTRFSNSLQKLKRNCIRCKYKLRITVISNAIRLTYLVRQDRKNEEKHIENSPRNFPASGLQTLLEKHCWLLLLLFTHLTWFLELSKYIFMALCSTRFPHKNQLKFLHFCIAEPKCLLHFMKEKCFAYFDLHSFFCQMPCVYVRSVIFFFWLIRFRIL